MYRNFIIPYLYEAQHVSGDMPPIIRSLKLHWQPLVLPLYRGDSRAVFVVGPAGRPKNCYIRLVIYLN